MSNNDEMRDGAVPSDEHDGSETNLKSRSRLPVVLVAVVTVILLCVLGYFVMRTSSPPIEEKTEVVVSVKVAKVSKEPIAKEVSAVGTVVPAEKADVAASISAPIRQMAILKNRVVSRGDTIAVLSSEDLVAQRDEARAALEEARLNLETVQKVQIPQAVAQSTKEVNGAKAALDNTRATFERRQSLYQKGGISLKELEASQLDYTNAQDAYGLAVENSRINRTGVNPNSQSIAVARIKQAEDRLSNLETQVTRGTVRAPITGIITDQYQFEGEFAQQGAKLVTLADISTVVVKAQFADSVVHDLKVGDAITVYPFEAQDEKMTGAVSLIGRSSDPQNRTIEVWAKFGNPRGLLPSNGAVEVVVESQPIDEALVVPAASVVLDATTSDEGIVMVVGDDMIAHETKVRVGLKQGDRIQILEGLEGTETVVVEGNYSLPDGTKVEVAADAESEKDK